MNNRYDFGHAWWGFFGSSEYFTIPLSEEDLRNQIMPTVVQKFEDEGIALAWEDLVEEDNRVVIEEINRKARYTIEIRENELSVRKEKNRPLVCTENIDSEKVRVIHGRRERPSGWNVVSVPHEVFPALPAKTTHFIVKWNNPSSKQNDLVNYINLLPNMVRHMILAVWNRLQEGRKTARQRRIGVRRQVRR